MRRARCGWPRCAGTPRREARARLPRSRAIRPSRTRAAASSASSSAAAAAPPTRRRSDLADRDAERTRGRSAQVCGVHVPDFDRSDADTAHREAAVAIGAEQGEHAAVDRERTVVAGDATEDTSPGGELDLEVIGGAGGVPD